MSFTKTRNYYKPFDYPWAYEAYKKQNEQHWSPVEVVLADDIRDFNLELTPDERNLLVNIFKFFTQSDVDVAGAYATHYLPLFKAPEVRMMLSSFANIEAVHQDAYSLLLETLGLEEDTYKLFFDIKEMFDKHEYMMSFGTKTIKDQLHTLAVFSGMIEGVQLFSSFAILLNFARFSLMKGMCEIVTWSIRDESLHVESMSHLFKQYAKENIRHFDDDLKCRIYFSAEKIVELEEKFIDVVFGNCIIRDLDKKDVKTYVRYIADRRLLGLGLKPIFKQKTNPLGWLDYILSGIEFANFFESKPTEYTKFAMTGSWYKDVFK